MLPYETSQTLFTSTSEGFRFSYLPQRVSVRIEEHDDSNISEHLSSAYGEPSFRQKSFASIVHLTFSTTLLMKQLPSSHFTDEDAEAQRKGK